MSEGVRLDKWLWAARCFRTRSQATDACGEGLVKIAGRLAKASHPVRVGEQIEVITPAGRRHLTVVQVSDERGGGEKARTLFTETDVVDDDG